jgi:hypothetical protein
LTLSGPQGEQQWQMQMLRRTCEESGLVVSSPDLVDPIATIESAAAFARIDGDLAALLTPDLLDVVVASAITAAAKVVARLIILQQPSSTPLGGVILAATVATARIYSNLTRNLARISSIGL